MMKALVTLALVAIAPGTVLAREQRPGDTVFKPATATSTTAATPSAGPVVSRRRKLSGIPVAVPITVGVLASFGLGALLIGGGNDASPN